MSAGRWTPEEDEVLRELYPTRGRWWDGWPQVLPGRTRDGVYDRVRRLGLRVDPAVVSQRRARATAERYRRPHPDPGPADPREGPVMGLLAEGLPPSAIDARLGYAPGTARRVISERWRRTRNGKED